MLQALNQFIPGSGTGTSTAYPPPSARPIRRWTAERVQEEFLGAWPSDHQFGEDLAASISKDKIGAVLKQHAGVMFRNPHLTAIGIFGVELLLRTIVSGVRNRNLFAGGALIGVEAFRRFGLFGAAGYQLNAWLSAVEAMKGDRTTKLHVAQEECARFAEILITMALTRGLGAAGKSMTRGSQPSPSPGPLLPGPLLPGVAAGGQLTIQAGQLTVLGEGWMEGALAAVSRLLGPTMPLVGAFGMQEAVVGANSYSMQEESPQGFQSMAGGNPSGGERGVFDAAIQIRRVKEILRRDPETLTMDHLTELIDRYSAASNATKSALGLDAETRARLNVGELQRKLNGELHYQIGSRLAGFIDRLLFSETPRLDDIAKTVAALDKYSQLPESERVREWIVGAWMGRLQQLQKETRLLQRDPSLNSEIQQLRSLTSKMQELVARPLANFSVDHLAELIGLNISAWRALHSALENGKLTPLPLNLKLAGGLLDAQQLNVVARIVGFVVGMLKRDRVPISEISKAIEVLRPLSGPEVDPEISTEMNKWIQALERMQQRQLFDDAVGNNAPRVPSLFRQFRAFVQLSESEAIGLIHKIQTMNLTPRESNTLEAILDKSSPYRTEQELILLIDEYGALRPIETLVDKGPRELSTDELVELRRALKDLKHGLGVDAQERNAEAYLEVPASNLAVVDLAAWQRPMVEHKLELVLRIEEKFPEMLLAALVRAREVGTPASERQRVLGVAWSLPIGSDVRRKVRPAEFNLEQICLQEGYMAESVNDGMVSFAGSWPTSASTDDVIRFFQAKPNRSSDSLTIDSFPKSKTVKLSNGSSHDLAEIRLYRLP